MPDTRKIFGQIYDRYINKIYRFIFFKVNSQEIAEDLASETFLKTWEVFKNEEKSIENMQAFLYRTARNLVIDYYREKGKVQIVSVDNPSITDPSQNLEEKEILRSDVNIVKAALTNLKDDYQNVIIWHYLDDLPIQEISYILGRTEDATRVLLHRALESLKKEIKEA
jgi:RNA polymerase sigma-70 factor (ECF subfamily)